MKRMTCLIFLFLVGCVQVSASPSPVPPSPQPVPISSLFAYNEQCPHVCWLGINPGLTTQEEARKILSSSSQVGSPYDVDDGGFRIDWHMEQMGVHATRVGIVLENGIVKTINFGSVPVTGAGIST